jgi:AbrB family looped-hinge helix DNA binding protein
MRTATVSGKGQVTIPAQLLRDLDVQPGSKLLVVPVRDGVMLLRQTDSLAESLGGSTGGVYGDVEEYVRDERRGWT